MELIELNELTPSQKEEVIELWNREYPAKISLTGLTEFDLYLNSLLEPKHLVLLDAKQAIKGWLTYFFREGGQWFAILLDSSLQGQGWGTRILDLAKEKTNELHGWVIPDDGELKLNGEVYTSPLGFYVKNQFVIHPDIQSIKKDTLSIKISWQKHR
ncbi:MAG: N-acetyltransferase [Lewinellaceae bacterium]|nr:N-acetyltransferase [Lewinellaceae bacterium]HQU55312.1 N-acetyltransferase [Saprospiraceae bacterium]